MVPAFKKRNSQEVASKSLRAREDRSFVVLQKEPEPVRKGELPGKRNSQSEGDLPGERNSE